MTDSILKSLQETDDQREKSAIVAEAIFALLPEETALVARRCVILHWFDQAIIEALLEDKELTIHEMGEVYAQLLVLPFIDSIPEGLTYQNLTREGLIKRYSLSQPEILQTAARLAAPHFEIREEDKKSSVEAFFCYIVSGEQQSSSELQKTLFEEASTHLDWQYLEALLQVQEEAEQLPFVQPLISDEQQFLLKGLVHRLQGRWGAAILDYQNALAINPRNILAYVSRGTSYAGEDRYVEALADYTKALQLDQKFAQAYLGRGFVYTKQGKYKEALKDTDVALRLGIRSDLLFVNKGTILYELGQYEDAVVSYDAALRLDIDSVNAYIGKGQALNELGLYSEALVALNGALRLGVDNANAYILKGRALNGLERYNEALLSFEDAIRINPESADAYRGKAQALSRLNRYEEATVAYERANQIEPEKGGTSIENVEGDELGKSSKMNQGVVVTRKSRKGALLRGQNKPFSSNRFSSIITLQSFWGTLGNAFAILVVCFIIAMSLLFFHSRFNAAPNGQNLQATAVVSTRTAENVQATATAQASAPANTSATVTAYQNILNQATSGTPVLNDPLNAQSNNNWDELSAPNSTLSGSCAFTGGVYQSSMPSKGYFQPCYAQNPTFSNFAYQVQMTIKQGDEGGILFRADTANSKFYLLRITKGGAYDLFVYTDNQGGHAKNLLSNSTTVFKQGLNETNTITVVAQGGNLYFYINGQYVDNINNTTLNSGKIGVFAESNINATIVSFTNAEVWQL